MAKPITRKNHVGERREKRTNGDIYVYERITAYDEKTRKTYTVSQKLKGKIKSGIASYNGKDSCIVVCETKAKDSLREVFKKMGGAVIELPNEEFACMPLLQGIAEKLKADFLPLIRQLLDCAAELSIAVFTQHFWIDRRFVADDIAAEKLEILKAMSAYAEESGTQFCLENLSEQVSDFSPAFAAIEGLRMTLDVGHGELLTARNTAYDFAAGWPQRIYHVHLHDNRGGDTVEDDLHLPLGAGVVDFAAILGCLRAGGYDRTMTMEVAPEFLQGGKKMIEQIWQKESPAGK